MMLGSKGLLTPLIPDCSALRALTILKNIRNPLIFLRKMASYSCFWRVPRLKIFMQASLHQISNLLTLVSCHDVARPLAVLTLHSFEFAAVLSPWPYLQKTGAEFIYSIPRPFFTSTGKQPTPYIPRYLSLSIAAIKFSSCSGVRFSIGLRILVVAMIPSRFSITLYAAILLFSQSVSFRRFVLCCHLAASS